MVPNCNDPFPDRRRTFWTVQACEKTTLCGYECDDNYGLKLYCPDAENPDGTCVDHMPGQQRSIRTNDWVRSLAIMILFTNGRLPESKCGYNPGARGGHWSDSYHTNDTARAGSTIRTLGKHGRISDALQEIAAIMKYDLGKMITYGVATAIDVTTKYLGGNVAQADIVIYGRAGDITRIGLAGSRVQNSWAWST